MNVLIIPEDFRNDQYILRPLIRSVLASAGKPNANVRVLTDPLVGGVDKALDLAFLQNEVLPLYRQVDLFLLIVDRDGQANRRAALLNLERQLCFFLGADRCLLAEAAIEEIEVWALAAEPLPWAWADVRSENHPKETYFEPFAKSQRIDEEPGGGRDTLGKKAASNLRRVRQLCPELNSLAIRVENFCDGQGCVNGPYQIPPVP
ncbi:hypothetical protein [Pseudoxanthomonas sacheonensis]|uniref:DUF4276 family protein n=1 Tax=Pseudoxanthomonas sacheonensis TaxID=443615 RepID=A0ABU1RUT4_9GAMM|nr:hypothetical protein [Pseudoxanthomonas sacheonensis]MDR6842529.1 hypothetical protein [Pseudoxanthomonas sacheonensis]